MARSTVALSKPSMLAVLFLSAASLPAEAFELDVHQSIVESALEGRIEASAVKAIVGAVVIGEPGTGARGSDIYQFSPERHFDGAPGHDTLCRHWGSAVDDRLDRVVAFSVPTDPERRKLADRTRALRAFGDVAHALADFYSHTNWVELYANTGKLPPLAPLLDTVCDFDRDSLKIPGEVQSGYFSVPEVVPIVGPITSCPDKPPAGYSYCHEQLNKDHARKGKGGKSIPNIGRTYHEVARELAIETTRKAWENVRERILARYGETKTIDAECIFAKLAWGGGRTCHRLWRIRGSVAENTHVTGVKEFAQRADITGLDFQFSWDPVRYPGPQGPDVQVLVKSRPSGGRVHWRTTAGSLPGPTITCDANGMNSSTEGGRALYKLSPEDEPLDLYDLIRFAASAIPKCEAIHPDLGRMPVPQMPPMRISVPLPEKAALGRCQGSGFSLKLRPGKYDFGPCFYATKATGQHLNFIRSMQLVLELVEK